MDFKRRTEFVEAMPKNQDQCLKFLIQSLPLALGRLFVDSKFSSDDRNAAETVINAAFASMAKMIIGVDWLDPFSDANAQTKLNGYIRNIGYPDWILDDTKMNDYHSGLNLTYDDPTENGNWYFDFLTVTTWAQVKVKTRVN